MRKLISLLLAAIMLLGCVSAIAEDAAPVKTGFGMITTITKSQVNIAYAAVTVDDAGVITSCDMDYIQAKYVIDATGKITTDKATQFQSKYELDDAYGMRIASPIGKEWDEQADHFVAYCIGKTIDEIKGVALTEAGKAADADLAAGCTMTVTEYLAVVEKAVNNAAHLGAKKGDVVKVAQVSGFDKSTADASATAAGKIQINAHVGAVTLNGDVITSCIIDAVQAKIAFDATGKITSDMTAPVASKTELQDGYNMRMASPIGKEWFEQSAGFSAYVTGKTLAEVAGIALNESGKPTDADLTATTTITITDFLAVVEQAGK